MLMIQLAVYTQIRLILVNYTSIDIWGLAHTISHTIRRLYPGVMMKAPVSYIVAAGSRNTCQVKREAFEVVGYQLDGLCTTHFILSPLYSFSFYSNVHIFHSFSSSLSFYFFISSFFYSHCFFLIYFSYSLSHSLKYFH